MNRKLSTAELQRPSPQDFAHQAKLPVRVLLDNVRSLNNVGSVFRSSDAFLVEKIYLGGITAQPPHREIQKTALGATETVAWEHHKDTVALIRQLKAEGVEIIAVEQTEQSESLAQFTVHADRPVVFIIGNEVFGVSDALVELADRCVEVPQFGTKHSLNLSVCTGILLWTACHQLKKLS
ncbi:MAG: RNA methyltransferase [Salibacteraceae bacterium]